MSETPLEWSKFEKALIKFVETNKTDARFLTLRRGCYVSYFGLWDEFSEKWKVSNEKCQSQWQNIINAYYNINAEPQKIFERRNTKYLDGRLSFLDPFIKQKMLERVPRIRRKEKKTIYAATKAGTNTPPYLDKIEETSTNDSSSSISLDNSNYSSNTVRDLKENMKSTKSMQITEETDKECCINFLRHVVTEKFDEFDERLIDYVKDYPILYDVRVSLNIEPTIRKPTEAKFWKVLMKKTDKSESMCREKWRQIRVEYFCVRKALDFNITIETPSLLKYLDGRLNFLEPVYLVIKIFSVGILTCKPLEEIIRNRGCAWDDFQLSIIQFVKENPIINNAFNINRRDSLHKDFWIQVSKHLHVSADCCMKRWNRIKYANIKFLEKNAGKKLDYTSLFDFRFKALSFLNKQDECIQLFNLKVDENIDNSSNIDEFEDVTKYEDVELVKSEPQNINFYDNVMEMEDTSYVRDENFESYIKPYIVHNDEPQPSTSANFISPGLEDSKSDDSRYKDGVNRSSKQYYSLNVFNDASLRQQLIKLEPEESNFNNTDKIENASIVNYTSDTNPDFVSYNDEPQPSTSTNFISTHIEDSKSADSTNEDDVKSTAKRKYISTDDNDSEELNALNIHKLNTNDFFHHIGRLVSERFSEENQQEFRIQCWDLLNSFRLEKDE